MEFYLTAFFELSTERKSSGHQIPWSSIDAFATRHGVFGDDYTQLFRLLRAMDARYLDTQGGK